MNPLVIGFLALLASTAAEVLHARRCGTIGLLAFGPEGRPRPWTRVVAGIRILCTAGLAWALTTLLVLPPQTLNSGSDDVGPAAAEEVRRVLFMLDMSPSMDIADAGPQGEQSRMDRIGEVLEAVISRLGTGDIRYSVQAFYTDALFVVHDARDLAVVHNVLNDLPLVFAFHPGKTDLGLAVRSAFEAADHWPKDSTLVFLCTDGDTTDLGELPQRPRSIRDLFVLGVGNTHMGTEIDEHQSIQDAQNLRELAYEMNGKYLDVNRRHVPTTDLQAVAIGGGHARGGWRLRARDLALVLTVFCAGLLSLLPFLLTWFGSGWKVIDSPHATGNPS